MIEPMKKVWLVCFERDRQEALERLRDLGVLHVSGAPARSAPASEEATAGLDRIQRALNVLESLTTSDSGDADSASPATTPLELADTVNALAEELKQLDDREDELRRIDAELEPWGSFSAERIEELRRNGIDVRLGVARRGELPDVPEPAVLHVVAERAGRVWFAVVSPVGFDPGFQGLPLPAITDREEVRRRMEALRNRRSEILRMLENIRAAHGPRLEEARLVFEDAVEFHRVLAAMERREAVALLQGYVPVSAVDRLRDAARMHAWAVMLRDPDPDDDAVPTRIVLPKWVEPIRAVLDMLNILPGYREVDISFWFLVFLSIFFAMLIGDAGYGVLFLLGTIAARRKFPKAPPQPFQLFAILSVTTVVWGALTGTWFAVTGLPAPLRGLTVPWLKDPVNVQRLCFFLGALHLTIAHVWNALIAAPSPKALGQVGWALILWGNYFLARNLVLNDPLPPAVIKVLYSAGIAGVILFSSPHRNPLKTVGGGLGNFVLGIVSSFVDVVSYIRLYAVGAASLAIEQTFNQMALGLNMPWWLRPLLAALILVAGHGLNILLGAMAIVVHGVRLNVLEFAGHLGLQWSGVPYRPFARRATEPPSDRGAEVQASTP